MIQHGSGCVKAALDLGSMRDAGGQHLKQSNQNMDGVQHASPQNLGWPLPGNAARTGDVMARIQLVGVQLVGDVARLAFRGEFVGDGRRPIRSAVTQLGT